MSFANGTPPAADLSVPPPSGGSPDQSKTTLWMGELEPWMDENFIKGVFLSTSGETVNVKVIRDKNSGYVDHPTTRIRKKTKMEEIVC